MIRVLLCDDHAILRQGISSLLGDHPEIEVVGEAANGIEAVEKVRALIPDIVIMDVGMPRVNGIDATEQIVSEFPDIRVIILSVRTSTAHIIRALRAGASGYLLKESTGDELVTAIQAVARGGRYFGKEVTESLVDNVVLTRDGRPLEDPLEQLSVRERQILQMLAEGNPNRDIAEHLHISIKTVETYRSRMMKKLNIPDYSHLILFAVKHGLVSFE